MTTREQYTLACRLLRRLNTSERYFGTRDLTYLYKFRPEILGYALQAVMNANPPQKEPFFVRHDLGWKYKDYGTPYYYPNPDPHGIPF